MRRHYFATLLLLFCLLGIAACGGGGEGGGTPPGPLPNPQPSIASLTPSSVTAGAPGVTLTVNGANFIASSVVRWSGIDRVTTFMNSTQLQAAISASDVTSAGSAQVTVYTPAPGGGVSNASTFTISTINNPAPVITSLSPSQVMSNSASFPLTVNGSGFVQGSVVRWNGSDRSTTFVRSTQLTAAIFAADVASTGTAQVTVFNPAPGGDSSSALTFSVAPPGVGVVERVSVDNNGGQLPGDSLVWFAGLSGDGRFVAFDYGPSPGGISQHVFVRDTCRGAPMGCTPSTVQISVANDGSQGNGANLDAAISADGRFVAFSSYSSNLVLGDTNGFPDVILRDTCAGAAADCTPSTMRVSVASDGAQGDGESHWPTISADGRFVAFYSEATNLVPGDTNGTGDAFVRDTCFGVPGGCVPSTFRVSVANDGSQGNDSSGVGSISGDGRFVAFDSAATNFVAGAGTGGVFVRDTCFGAPAGCTPSTTLVASEGSSPVISADGRVVSFESGSPNLVASDTNGKWDVFVRDTCVGAPAGCTPSTILVSVANDGSQGNNDSPFWYWSPVSGNGRFVVFDTLATNLVSGITTGQGDVFVRDTCVGAPAGCTPSTLRVNVGWDGSPSTPSIWPMREVAISADGRFVAFDSDANNMVPGDTNSCGDYVSCFDVFLAQTGAAAAPAAPSNASSDASANRVHLLSLNSDFRTAPFASSRANLAATRRGAPSFNHPRHRPSGRSPHENMNTKEEIP